MPAFGWFGIYSVAFIATYAIAMRMVFLFEKKRMSEVIHERARPRATKKLR